MLASSYKQTISLVHNSSLSISTLTTMMVSMKDTVNYACQPSNTKTGDTMHLQVVEKELGEKLLVSGGNTLVVYSSVSEYKSKKSIISKMVVKCFHQDKGFCKYGPKCRFQHSERIRRDRFL